MLRLSKKLLFAIEAVVDIAYHAGPGPVRSTDISRRQGIPRRYLEQVLQQLVHKGVLSGQRGPRGGYRLARERRRITVGEIVRIIGQLEGASDPASEPDGSEIGVKVVRPLWIDMQREIMGRFDTVTVEELCNRAREQNIPSETARIPDFSI
ncbi:MAG: RrF2 family transcriptional regulator [Kiloniellaceae bacterium]